MIIKKTIIEEIGTTKLSAMILQTLLRSVNREDFFSLKDDQNCHDLRVGYRSLSWQALLGPYERYGNLDFIGKPFLFSGATFFEMSVGLRLVNNTYRRGFRNVDALFFGLGGLAPADSLFFQEEDYSNIPRTIRDRYTQGFLEAKSGKLAGRTLCLVARRSGISR